VKLSPLRFTSVDVSQMARSLLCTNVQTTTIFVKRREGCRALEPSFRCNSLIYKMMKAATDMRGFSLIAKMKVAFESIIAVDLDIFKLLSNFPSSRMFERNNCVVGGIGKGHIS
jgi:hypothetical protein